MWMLPHPNSQDFHQCGPSTYQNLTLFYVSGLRNIMIVLMPKEKGCVKRNKIVSLMIPQSKCWNSIINDNYHSTIQSLNKKYIKNNLKTLFSKYVFVLVSLLVIAAVSVFNHCALFSKDRFHSISDCKQMEERKKTKKKRKFVKLCTENYPYKLYLFVWSKMINQ